MFEQPSTRIGVLVAQLGTPDAPTPEALRRYLKEFLSDMRVVDMNPLLWQMILRFGVLRRRPARSAALYQRIWTEDGSPLMVHSLAQVAGLQERLGENFKVRLGMRYGNPSIAEAMRAFADEGIDRILVFSMFPQFSSATTASLYDAINTAAGGNRFPLWHDRKRDYPTLRFVPPYYEHPAYIDALKVRVEETVSRVKPDHYLITFHGIPKRFVDEGDPYRKQCETTAYRLADALNLQPEQWTVSFQSQFGREEWLTPYTEDVLHQMGEKGFQNLLVTCPSFTSDCLETLDEIGNEGAHQFHAGGGKNLHLVPCLNSHPVWLDTMTAIVHQEAAGWTQPEYSEPAYA